MSLPKIPYSERQAIENTVIRFILTKADWLNEKLSYLDELAKCKKLYEEIIVELTEKYKKFEYRDFIMACTNFAFQNDDVITDTIDLLEPKNHNLYYKRAKKYADDFIEKNEIYKHYIEKDHYIEFY